MPELRLIPLDELLSPAQLRSLTKQLHELGVEELDLADEAETEFDEVLSEDQLTDFMDRLDAHDLGCDLYLPVDFEGQIEIGDQSIGSAHALLAALDEIREELGIDQDEDEEGEEEEEELDLDVIEEQLRSTWRTFHKAASTCVEKQVPLHILA